MSPLRQRVHNLRRRLIAASVALFITLFGGLTIQLASGHDPALKSSATATTPSANTTSTTTSSTSRQASRTTLAPMTTSQS
jgi:hypothetical protein